VKVGGEGISINERFINNTLRITLLFMTYYALDCNALDYILFEYALHWIAMHCLSDVTAVTFS